MLKSFRKILYKELSQQRRLNSLYKIFLKLFNIHIKEIIKEAVEDCLKRYGLDIEFVISIPYDDKMCYDVDFINKGATVRVEEFDEKLMVRAGVLNFSDVEFFHELMEDIASLDIF